MISPVMRGGGGGGGGLCLSPAVGWSCGPPQAHLQEVHRSTTATRGPDGVLGSGLWSPAPLPSAIASNTPLARPTARASLNGVGAFGNDNNNRDKHSPFLKSLR